MSIFSAFREFNATHPKSKFANFEAPPLFAETLDQRKAALARLRVAFPECFAPPTLSTDPRHGPMAEVDALAERFKCTPIDPSPFLIQKYGIGPYRPDPMPDGREAPPPEENVR